VSGARLVGTTISPEVAQYPDSDTGGSVSESGPGESSRLIVGPWEGVLGDHDGELAEEG
jgi:hypothetical protein